MDFKKYFPGLKFNEMYHSYAVEGRPEIKFVSVTGLVNMLGTEPNVEEIAAKRGVDPEELRKEWKDLAVAAGNFGTRIHAVIEHFLNTERVLNTDLLKDAKAKMYIKSFVNFYKKYKDTWDFKEQELRVYDLELGVAGTIDCIAYNKKTGKYDIIDWKTNKEISKQGWNKMKIFEGKSDSNFEKYSAQISLYRYILERNIPDLKIGQGFIAHITSIGVELLEIDYDWDFELFFNELEKLSR